MFPSVYRERRVPELSKRLQHHRDTARRLAGAALRALTDLDWPDVTGRIKGREGAVGVVIPGSTVRNLVRLTISKPPDV